MNKLLVFIVFMLISISHVFAGSINPAVYKTMSEQSYRTNYNRQLRTNPNSYWRTQSDFRTRNRTFQNYNDYSRHMNNVWSSGNQYRRMY